MANVISDDELVKESIMKSRIISVFLATTMLVGMLAGCASAPADTQADSDTAASSDAIRLVNGKIEIDSQLKELAAEYEAETGQEIIIESLGGGVDIQATIKGYYQAGDMPDIFVIGGDGDYTNWEGLTADLSDCEFAANTELSYYAQDGTLAGFPYAVEGYGITYNADILETAGIDPSALINYAAYEEAFAIIDGMKDELGLVSVCSVAAESGQMYWSTGNHLFGYYLSGGLDREDSTYIDMLLEGKIDEERMTQFAEFLDMLYDYSDYTTLISGTYDDQLALWAQGKTAFITQGNWIDTSFEDYNITFNVGIAPFAFTEEDMTGVLADSPSWWCVAADSDNVQGCKDFLDWLAASEAGQEGMVMDCGMVSPFTNVTVTPEYPLATCLSEYLISGDTYAWDWIKLPEGIAMSYTGYVFEAFAKDEVDVDGFVKLMETQIQSCIASK